MQKRANRILSALIALVMVLSMLPATVFATGETESVLKGWNLILGENIGVKFTLNSADYTVTTTVNGVEVTPAVSGETVTVNVAAAQMTDTIGLTVKNGEETVHTGEYSVRQYAETILNGEYDDYVKDMVKEMLNYGAYAQEYFNYKPNGTLSNAGYELENNASVPSEVPSVSPEGSADGVSLYGMSLVFQSRTAVRFYFTVSGDVKTHEFKVGDTACTPVAKNGMYYVEVGNINPQDLDKAITVIVDGTLSVSYSPLTYVARKYNSDASSDALKDLVQAMYGYYEEAKYYSSVVPAGSLKTSVHGATQTGVFVTMPENAAPYGDWTVYYNATGADNIKLIRNEEMVSIAIPDRQNIAKTSATDYFIRLEEHTIGAYAPFTTEDVFIVEGMFYYGETRLYIDKSYIYYDGSAWVVSETEPQRSKVYEMGVLTAHEAGMSIKDGVINGIYATGIPGTGAAFNTDWTVEYSPVSAENYKLIRNGVTYNVGIPGQNALVMHNDGWLYLKAEAGVMSNSNLLPLQKNDILVLEGQFTCNKDAMSIINITKTYILIGNGTVTFTRVYDMGVLTAHEAGVSIDGGNGSVKGIYATGIPGTGATFNTDWTVEYSPVSAENYKLIRNGVTYNVGIPGQNALVMHNDGWLYLKAEAGVMSNSNLLPLQKNDILVLDGLFTCNKDVSCVINITKTYILIGNGTVIFARAYDMGVLTAHEAGVSIDGNNGSVKGIYATGIPGTGATFNTDWSVEYSPVSAENYKLIRNGVIHSVGIPGQNALVMHNDGWLYLKAEAGVMSNSNLLPLQKDDILVLEGQFTCNKDASCVINITKTYILIGDGTVSFSNIEPEVDITVSGGIMSAHSDGWDATDGISFTMAENVIPVDDSAAFEYTAQADVVKLVRSNQTYSLSASVIKYGTTSYYLSLGGNQYLPLQNDDYLIVEGSFVGGRYTLNIDKTYIQVSGDDLIYTTTEPTITSVYNMGVLTAHEAGLSIKDGIINGIFATGIPNTGAPFNTDWTVEYSPVSAENYKLIRNGVTYNVGFPGKNALVMHDDGWLYLKAEAGVMSNSNLLPLQKNDIIVLEGQFTCNKDAMSIINITKSYILIGEGSVTFSDVEPKLVYEMGVLTAHEAGVTIDGNNGSVTDIYATGTPGTGAAYDTDWRYEYTPVAAENYKLIRDGVTYNVGLTGQGTMVMHNDGLLYIKAENHVFNDGSKGLLPLQKNDILVLEGEFYCNQKPDSVIRITKTYILIGVGTATFSATQPEVIKPYEVGVLESHQASPSMDGNNIKGIYAFGEPTGATFNTDWSVEYAPAKAENYKLIRNGVTYNIGKTDAGTIVMTSQTEFYIKQESGAFNDASKILLPLQDGDVLVLEGEWNCRKDANSIINITKTYITISETNDSAVFSGVDPKTINVGTLYAHDAGYSGSGNISGIYFMTNTNAVPSNDDWSVRYAATDASNIKLIRNGVTTNIAVVGQNTIVKMSDQAGWLCLENSSIISTYPIVEGDVLVVEGAFTNGANGYTMVIDKTYIIVSSNKPVFTSHYESTEYGTVVLPTSADNLTIGTWNGSHHTFGTKQLKELKAAGITKLIGVDPTQTSANNFAAWLDRVYSYGISVVVDLRSWDGNTAPSYANHPGVIGFLMYDEPSADDFDDLASLKRKFDSVMPADKLFYVNLLPENASNTALGGNIMDELTGVDYDTDYVAAFLSKLNVEVLSWDNYSLLEGNGIRTDYYHNFEIMASKNVPMWYTMLSAGHGTTATSYATPTAEELRWQMAVAMTYGVQNIDHYIYTSHESDYSCMVEYGTLNPTDLYYDIKDVDNEYLAWGNIFMAYNWVGVAGKKAGSSSTMLDMLNNNINLGDHGISAVATSQDILVGVFENGGNKAYMVTNAGSAGSANVGDGKNLTMTDATVTLTLDAADYKCVAVIENGEISYVAVNADNTVTLSVEAYEGVFIIPVLN